MHFGFNNRFNKAMRTRPIFQKQPKNILFSLVYEIMNLHVKHIPNIKKVVLLWILEWLSFYLIR